MVDKIQDPYITVAKLAGLHGIQGWIKVISHTRPKDNLKKYKVWQIRPNDKAPWQNQHVVGFKQQGKGFVAKLEGVADRTEAEQFVGWEVAIHQQQLPTLRKNEYYWRDLIGLRVSNHEEQYFGVVDHLIETGANDVLVVKDQDSERLIPYVLDEYVKHIDLEEGVMIVEWDADF